MRSVRSAVCATAVVAAVCAFPVVAHASFLNGTWVLANVETLVFSGDFPEGPQSSTGNVVCIAASGNQKYQGTYRISGNPFDALLQIFTDSGQTLQYRVEYDGNVPNRMIIKGAGVYFR